jgi:muramoyltetrapeptide carboxypeptidase
MKKHIYVFSPSSAIRDKAAFKRGIKRLITLGHEVEIDESALHTYQRFAGDDATRLNAIYRAAQSGADVVLISRGGYGLTRLLPHIDYKIIANAIDRGMKFVGFSDFTAFQMAVLAKTGLVTWAGPSVGEDFGAQPIPDDIMEACFDDLLSSQGEGTGWRLPKSVTNSIEKSATQASTETFIDVRIDNAVLWGGNLAMLASLTGTSYMPIVNDGVLFIEDVGEHPYRIERMLAQLLQAGILEKQKAIIFGQFNNYKLAAHDKGYKLASVVAWLQSQVSAKVLTGLPFGHVPTKVLLPIGLPVTLAIERRDAFLLWGHQH